MAIEIPYPVNNQNVSMQIGDVLYYVATTGLSNTTYGSDPIRIGVITNIDQTLGLIRVENEENTPSQGDFLMFQKDKTVNNTSLIGYYAEIELKNNSLERAELFAVSSEIAPSSK